MTAPLEVIAHLLANRGRLQNNAQQTFDNSDSEDLFHSREGFKMTKNADDFNKKQLDAGKLSTSHVTKLVEYWQKGHGLQVDGFAGDRETIPSIDWEMGEFALPPEPEKSKVRGLVVPLTSEQIVQRALYLAGKASIDTLDQYVRKTGAPKMCPAIYYLLKGHNGGKDPTASDPADRWSNPGSNFVNITCDCSGGNSWMGGFDRYQEQRMRPTVKGKWDSNKKEWDGYGGWFNTDSKILDATLPLQKGERRCFESVGRPESGTMIICKSGSPGHDIGHEGRVVGYRGDLNAWDPKKKELWDLIDVVDVSSRGAGNRANLLRNGRGWYGTNAMFLRSVMTP